MKKGIHIKLKPFSHSRKKINECPVIEKILMDETDDILHLQFKINGLYRKNFKILINDNNLTVSAICRLKDNGKWNFISCTSFFELPCKVNTEKIWCDLSAGILCIMVPRQIARLEFIGHKDINLDWFNRNQINKIMLEN